MSSSLFVNTFHVFFESVLTMDNVGMVAMFESLVATGLKGFLGYPAVIHEAALLEFFQNGSVRDGLVISTVNGMTVEISEQLFAETFELPVEVSTSGKKREMTIEFRLLCDILAKTISVKAGFNYPGEVSDDGCNHLWSLGLCHTNQSSTGERSKLGTGRILGVPYSKILIEKTVHRYISLNDKVGMEDVTDEPRVKKTPVRKAASKKRPAVVTAAERVVKKKRTTKSKSGSSKDKLEILPVAQEAVPLQIFDPTAAARTEQPPSAPKRKIQKRKRRLVLGSDDDIVEQPAAEVASETTVEEPAVEVVAISASITALRESFSNLVANQSRDSRKTNTALSEVMCKIDHVQRVFLDCLAEQNETFRGLFKRSLQEAQNDNNALSLALKAVRTQNVILSTDLEATRKEVKDIKATLSKDFDDKLADIRNELLEFRVDTQGQLASLGTHLAELIAFLTNGSDDKKGEDSSSRRPQPPPDNQSRPSGGSGGSGKEQMSRVVLLEVVLGKAVEEVKVREEETVVVPQKE
ncbi:receptor-like protein kinase [Dorcoceras hygrometricum]|uniref:Receptor-like protein kinase n=1 Tax=Dorcoceras hygrometricum TaxID=472368 RepID=A0A2Z7C2I3_9LAMI|nr:receptor-like protein kinase [Dorcoceras hygrometricum]